MNREMRRLSEREERRSKKQQGGGRGGGRPPRSGGGGGGGGRGGGKPEQRSIWTRLVHFLREVRTELERVSWPTRQQMIAFTTVTLITTTVLTLVVFAMDLGFRRGVLSFIRALT